MNVTVAENGAGPLRYVTGLEQSDFEVFEDGVKQDVTVFNKTNSPIALSLLMDSSASMEQKLPLAQEAAIGFVKRLRPQDLAEVIDFDDRAVVSQGFTSDINLLEKAIRASSAGGPTSLYQALYIAINGEFKKLKKTDVTTEQPRRQAVVLLSDGLDTTSMFTFDDIMDIVKRSETAVYTIGLKDTNEPQSKAFNEALFVLRQFAQQTGGRAFFPNQLSDLSGVYGEIADELSSQYTLGYTSKNQRRDGSWRRIVVQIKDRKNVSVRTKQGYFAVRN
jgi:Ca-activated chloride channel family protein